MGTIQPENSVNLIKEAKTLARRNELGHLASLINWLWIISKDQSSKREHNALDLALSQELIRVAQSSEEYQTDDFEYEALAKYASVQPMWLVFN